MFERQRQIHNANKRNSLLLRILRFEHLREILELSGMQIWACLSDWEPDRLVEF